MQEEASETTEPMTVVEPEPVTPSVSTVDTGTETPSSSTVAPPSGSVATVINEEIANGYRQVVVLNMDFSPRIEYSIIHTEENKHINLCMSWAKICPNK